MAGGGLFGVVNVAKQFKERLKLRAAEGKSNDKESKEQEDRAKVKRVINKGHGDNASDDEDEPPMPVIKVDRPNQSCDRLAKDKVYLTQLTERLTSRRDIAHDPVQRSIKKTTFETLEYLKKREQFWEQLEMRKDEGASIHVESYRWLM